MKSERTIHIEKLISLHTTRDPALGDLVKDGLDAVRRAPEMDRLIEQQGVAWNRLWERFDVQVDVAPEWDLSPYSFQLILRLHTFHLLQTASQNTVGMDVSVPARGWTGEAYRGHIFWDEAYVLPFYTLRAPEIARSLLLYRFRRLGEARAGAEEEGYAGAMFPWQSGSNGREETQVIHLNPRSGRWDPDRSHLQRHVNAAIAYNVWTYYRTTKDREFLHQYGAEILLEIARFWSSLCFQNKKDGRFEIHGVMGPDEFHEAYSGTSSAESGGLRNNAYTNVTAAWCLDRAIRALKTLDEPTRSDLMEHLGLTEEEIVRWGEISERMALPLLPQGILEQFEGYGELDDPDWEAYREKYGDIGRLDRILKAEGVSPDRYKVSKQADVCMLFYLFDQEELTALLARSGYPLTDAKMQETIEYYRQRTSHGSTLSHLVFAAVLDAFDREEAWKHYMEALRSDVEDIQGGTTPEGIHTAVMAGTVRHVIERFAGIRLAGEGISLTPRLPDGLSRIRCVVSYRGSAAAIAVTPSEVEVAVVEGAPVEVPVHFAGTVRNVRPGEHAALYPRSVGAEE